jgi:hypothetical protein
MNFLGKLFDDRFREHRKRSTSAAGVVAAQVAGVLFVYRYFIEHRWSGELFAVALTFVAIKIGLLAWYSLND